MLQGMHLPQHDTGHQVACPHRPKEGRKRQEEQSADASERIDALAGCKEAGGTSANASARIGAERNTDASKRIGAWDSAMAPMG